MCKPGYCEICCYYLQSIFICVDLGKSQNLLNTRLQLLLPKTFLQITKDTDTVFM